MSFIETVLNLLGGTFFTRILGALFLFFACYWVYRLIVQPVGIALQGMWRFWRMRKRPIATLEITPHKHIDKAPLATEHLFGIIESLMGKYDILPMEIDASREDGIRYLIHTAPDNIAPLQRQIAAYLPEAKFRVIDTAEPLETTSPYTYALDIKQSRHYAYPLQAHEDLSVSDPANYIAGAMTKLKPGEHLTMQVVLTPHSSFWTNRLYNTIHSQGYAVLDGKIMAFIRSRPIWIWIVTGIYALITNAVLETFYLLVLLLIVSVFLPKEEPKLTESEKEFFAEVLNKLSKPLFRTDIRLLVTSYDPGSMYELARGVQSSLAPLGKSGFQQLYAQRLYPHWLGQRIVAFKLKHRIPSFLVFDSNILAASELASIYHFPYGTIKTEGMVRSHSRTLPATLGMKNNKFDVVLGQNNHHGEVTPIGLTAAERERHVFIIGGTGNGKTTMLQYAIVQDIQNGKGVAVVDPHGDMAETLLRHVPEERIDDVIYFNPDDLAHPIGLNLLELTPGLEGDELLREKDVVTESVVSVFRKIFSDDDTGGHRIEYVLRNAIQTALTVKDATLFTVYDLLNDPAYRKQVLKTIDDKNLINFWKQELGKAGDMQKVKMAAGITAKIGRFLFSASAKRILEQPRSTIDFDEILDGKILICNFSKGLLGEDTSELFGVAVLAKLQLAALRRARIKQSDRKPFYLFVDEFQNFATPSFVQLLSEARKYKFYLTMAEQSTSQQDDQQMVNIILANVGTIICFRSGNPADEKLALPLFEPYIEKGEIANLPSFNFYMRVSAQKSHEPLSGETVVLEESQSQNADKIIKRSRSHWSTKPHGTQPPKYSSEQSQVPKRLPS